MMKSAVQNMLQVVCQVVSICTKIMSVKRFSPSGELVEIYAADNSGNAINSLRPQLTQSEKIMKTRPSRDQILYRYHSYQPHHRYLKMAEGKYHGTDYLSRSSTRRIDFMCVCKRCRPSSSDADKWSTGTADLNLELTSCTIPVHSRALSLVRPFVSMIRLTTNQMQPVPSTSVSMVGSNSHRHRYWQWHNQNCRHHSDGSPKILKTTELTLGTNTNGIVFRKIQPTDIARSLHSMMNHVVSPKSKLCLYHWDKICFILIDKSKSPFLVLISQLKLFLLCPGQRPKRHCGVWPIWSCLMHLFDQNPVPNITTYKTPLQTAMAANQYGYSLSRKCYQRYFLLPWYPLKQYHNARHEPVQCK